jgi:hypothetical protein
MKKAIVLLAVCFLAVQMNVVMATESGNESTSTAGATKINFSGQVIDENTGETLAGVNVKVDGTSLSTYTDFDGKFSFKSLDAGKVNVSVNYISYQPKQLEVEATCNKEVNIALVQK